MFFGLFPFVLRDSKKEKFLALKPLNAVTNYEHLSRSLGIVCELQIVDRFPEMDSSTFSLSSFQLYHFIHHPPIRAFQVVQK